jgi:hypothetical protein
MSRQLIDHSDDLRRLRDEGYELEVRESHLLIHHIPYVTSSRALKYGTLVSTLSLAGDRTTRPDSHVVFFAGEFPCHRDGAPIEQLRHRSARQQLASELIVDHSFSNKPSVGYSDYYEKMITYTGIISAPAMALDPQVTPRTFGSVIETGEESPFAYHDTHTSRYGIAHISQKLKGHKVGIVGVGGTGSYILDLVAKSPVAQIHIFDGDIFLSHNAFRAPGAIGVDELRASQNKANYFSGVYRRMHSGVVPHPYFIDASNVVELLDLDFVFVCVDRGNVKRLLFERLCLAKIPFIDVGIGVEIANHALLGIVRTTTIVPNADQCIANRIPFQDGGDDVYGTAVQVAELNALNAAMAVIKWKKLLGFYQDVERERNTTYTINVNMVLNDDHTT